VMIGAFFAVASPGGAAGPRSSHASAVGGLDHFLCYDASAVPGVVPITAPAGVSLLNQFSSTAFKPKFNPVDLHCNPALKVANGKKFPPKSPSFHLFCFAITGKQAPNAHVVAVSNQFGRAKLTTGAPNQFCLPSLKSLQTPPVFNPPAPNEIRPDHFTCYPVKVKAGAFKPPASVMVRDQFSTALVPVTVGAPQELCVPTQKMIRGAIKAPITNPAAHLLCFRVSKTPAISPVWDQNQFGTGELNIGLTRLLCLPSAKKLIK
jgi:hypothetical protein